MAGFTFSKTSVIDIEIEGKMYKVDLSDKKLLKHQEAVRDIEKAGDDVSELKDCLRRAINAIFLHEPFDEFYKMSGGSFVEMGRLISYVGETVRKKVKRKR